MLHWWKSRKRMCIVKQDLCSFTAMTWSIQEREFMPGRGRQEVCNWRQCEQGMMKRESLWELLFTDHHLALSSQNWNPVKVAGCFAVPHRQDTCQNIPSWDKNRATMNKAQPGFWSRGLICFALIKNNMMQFIQEETDWQAQDLIKLTWSQFLIPSQHLRATRAQCSGRKRICPTTVNILILVIFRGSSLPSPLLCTCFSQNSFLEARLFNTEYGAKVGATCVRNACTQVDLQGCFFCCLSQFAG